MTIDVKYKPPAPRNTTIGDIPNGTVFYADNLGTAGTGIFVKVDSRVVYITSSRHSDSKEAAPFGGLSGGWTWTSPGCKVEGYRPVTKLNIEVEF